MTADTEAKQGKKLSIASGKGGTGKTTVASVLAMLISARGEQVELLDCDVDEPNVHLHFDCVLSGREPVKAPRPVLDESLCTMCGNCEKACRFNAIMMGMERAYIQESLCHSCGGCVLACPTGALRNEKRRIGYVETYSTRQGIRLCSGRSEIGETSLTRIIREVRSKASLTGLTIIDSPPGTSCSLSASVEGTDYCLIVAEPTDYGVHDMDLLIEALEGMGIPYGVLANKAGFGPVDLSGLCRERRIAFIGEIPFDTGFYSRSIGENGLLAMPVSARSAYEQAVEALMERLGR